MANAVYVYFNDLYKGEDTTSPSHISIMTCDSYGRHLKLEYTVKQFKTALTDGSLFKCIQDVNEDVSFNYEIICSCAFLSNVESLDNDNHIPTEEDMVAIYKALNIND